MPDLSIIIVNYKTPQLICNCLASVCAYTKGTTFELLVVDNQSTDDSQAIIQTAYPAVRWFQMGYFKSQVQVSQLLWVRKQYGLGAYLMLILHYRLMIPVVFVWKTAVNIRDRQPLFGGLENQRAFAKQVGVFLRFFWKTLFNRPDFYKV